MSEAVGSAQPALFRYTLNLADLSDVAFAPEIIAWSSAGVVGAVGLSWAHGSARLPALLIISGCSCGTALLNRRALREPRPTKCNLRILKK
jgi:hypothetical protein